MFRYSFSEAIPIFFNRLIIKGVFSLSDRYKIFTCNWLWIEICENVQYRSWALQHVHVRKLRAIWRISRETPRKKLARKLHAAFLHANLRVFLRWLILLVINTRKLRVFLYISKRQQPMMADVKLETDIVEKRPFAVKKILTIHVMLQLSLTSRTLLCKFLSCLLRPGFKLQHTILHVNKLGCYLARRLLFWNTIKSEIYYSLLRPWLLAKAGFQITIRYFYVKNRMLLVTPTVVLKYIQSSVLQYSVFFYFLSA